jgi:hypothetical protein
LLVFSPSEGVMPIEFRCNQCAKLLRVGDDAAGKQARCPMCGTVLDVPTPAASEEPTLAMPSEGNPFAAMPSPTPAGSPFAAAGPGDTDNPYQSPADFEPAALYPPAYVADRVAAPAIGLIITGSLGLLMQCIGTVRTFFMLQDFPKAVANDPAFMAMGGAQLVIGLLGVVLNILIIVGGVKMRRLESHGLAMAAAILAMIPCLSPCCLLGLPFGIWAIVVLSSDEVRAAFR